MSDKTMFNKYIADNNLMVFKAGNQVHLTGIISATESSSGA